MHFKKVKEEAKTMFATDSNLLANDELQFNVDHIKKMRTNVKQTISDLRDGKSKLKSSLESLKGKWNTPAGKNS